MKQLLAVIISLLLLCPPSIGLVANKQVTFAGTGTWNIDIYKSYAYPTVERVEKVWGNDPRADTRYYYEHVDIDNFFTRHIASLTIKQSKSSIRITSHQLLNDFFPYIVEGEKERTIIENYRLGKTEELISVPHNGEDIQAKKTINTKLSKNKIKIKETILEPDPYGKRTNTTTIELLKNGKSLKVTYKVTLPEITYRLNFDGTVFIPTVVYAGHYTLELFFNKQ